FREVREDGALHEGERRFRATKESLAVAHPLRQSGEPAQAPKTTSILDGSLHGRGRWARGGLLRRKLQSRRGISVAGTVVQLQRVFFASTGFAALRGVLSVPYVLFPIG